jgi:hypothetical protein
MARAGDAARAAGMGQAAACRRAAVGSIGLERVRAFISHPEGEFSSRNILGRGPDLHRDPRGDAARSAEMGQGTARSVRGGVGSIRFEGVRAFSRVGAVDHIERL